MQANTPAKAQTERRNNTKLTTKLEKEIEGLVLQRIAEMLPGVVHDAVHEGVIHIIPDSAPAAEQPAKAGGAKLLDVIKIEKNGVVRPPRPGKCLEVWQALDAMYKPKGRKPAVMPTLQQIKDHAIAQGWNESNARVEFYRWKKFMGL